MLLPTMWGDSLRINTILPAPGGKHHRSSLGLNLRHIDGLRTERASAAIAAPTSISTLPANTIPQPTTFAQQRALDLTAPAPDRLSDPRPHRHAL